jgi:hypothetical protein
MTPKASTGRSCLWHPDVSVSTPPRLFGLSYPSTSPRRERDLPSVGASRLYPISLGYVQTPSVPVASRRPGAGGANEAATLAPAPLPSPR